MGVEYAYGYNQTSQVQVSQIKALVDKVKDYTNLFVMGSVGLTFDRTSLSEACDYVFKTKLNFIVLFTGLGMYSYNITQWMVDAKVRYGNSFLGIDRYDEPGGNQLDSGTFQLINSTMISSSTTYADVAKTFTDNLSVFPNYYLQFAPKVFTADYGLYWFDYKSNYTSIFAEFVEDDYLMFCTNFDLKELINIKPVEGSVYIKSVCEPFDAEMEMDWERVMNWINHFGIAVNSTHVSGHASGPQLKEFVTTVKPKVLIPVHTENATAFASYCNNVKLLKQLGETVTLN